MVSDPPSLLTCIITVTLIFWIFYVHIDGKCSGASDDQGRYMHLWRFLTFKEKQKWALRVGGGVLNAPMAGSSRWRCNILYGRKKRHMASVSTSTLLSLAVHVDIILHLFSSKPKGTVFVHCSLKARCQRWFYLLDSVTAKRLQWLDTLAF